ncbi:MAG: DHHA1 domain-containing protein [Candidatus Hadarchaeota archaeon]
MNLAVKILTHGDADGICAGALAKSLFTDAEVWFTRPINLLRDLNAVKSGDMVIICDIAISEPHKEGIFNRMRELAQKEELIYVDHHPFPYATLKWDIPATQIAHEISTSGAELVFRLLIKEIKSDLDRVALWGAIGDYCEDTDFVRKGLNKYDRRTIYMEAGLLSQALGEAAGDYDYKRDVLYALSKGIPPTEIPDVVERAIKATKREWDTYEYVKAHTVQEGSLAIVRNLPSGSLGKAALYALGVSSANVGVCTRQDEDEVDVSLRRRVGAKVDLNELLRRIAVRFKGSGGGHEGAAGATVPAESLEPFLNALKNEISPILMRNSI